MVYKSSESRSERKEKKPMFTIIINDVVVYFVLFQDKNEDLERLNNSIQKAKRVFCVDTPPTKELLGFLYNNQQKQFLLFDHHGVDDPQTEREREIATISDQMKELVTVYQRTSRKENPSCVTLVKDHKALPGDAIIADADLDGLLTAMALCDITYLGIEKDAQIVDGPRALQKEEELSPYMRLFKQALCSLPDYKDKTFLRQKAEVYQAYVGLVQGQEGAQRMIASRAESYEKALTESERLLKEATTTFKDHTGTVWLTVTTTEEEKYLLEPIAKAHEDGLLSVTIKKGGPIGDLFGVQITISRTQKGSHLNLLSLVEEYPKGKEVGVIANQPFMIHLNHVIFEKVFPKLEAFCKGS